MILINYGIVNFRHQKRQAAYGGDDYVDYGAYTGKKGAFGWYTDHPVGKGH